MLNERSSRDAANTVEPRKVSRVRKRFAFRSRDTHSSFDGLRRAARIAVAVGALVSVSVCSVFESRPTRATTPIDGKHFWGYLKPPIEVVSPRARWTFAPAVLSTADSGSCGFEAAGPEHVLMNHFITARTRDGGAMSMVFFADSLGNLVEIEEFRSSLPFFTPIRGLDSLQADSASLDYEQRASFTSIALDLKHDRGTAYNIVGGKYSKAREGTIAQFDSLPSLEHTVERAKRMFATCQQENPKAVRDAMIAESDSIRKQLKRPPG